jgi:transmembrane sensor
MSENPQTDALAQAARWRIRLAESNCDCAEELRDWLLADPRNTEAWRKVQVPWEMLGDHAASPEFVHRRQSALAHAHKARLNRPSFNRFRSATALGLSAAIVLLTIVTGTLWQLYHYDVYRTKAGERRVVTLSDGSEIALDSGTEVAVRYGKHSRELTLVSGQARFNVAHDVLRPFAVTANGHQVVATGTSFVVDQLGSELLVTLIEGHVVVLPGGTPVHNPENHSRTPVSVPAMASDMGSGGETSKIVLDAGEQLVLAPHAAPTVTRVNVVHAVAWESGTLVFDNEPLSSVVLRVGRYGPHPIVIADEPTSKLRISGVFHEGDVAGFVSTVVSYLSVRAEKQQDGSVRLSSGASTGTR